MGYDEKLADRIRAVLAKADKLPLERKMFGGICFMVDGAMCCGVLNDDLIVKVEREKHDEALAQPHARPFDFSGRPMKGILYVGPKGTATAAQLKRWIDRGLAHVATRPKETKKAKPRAPASASVASRKKPRPARKR